MFDAFLCIYGPRATSLHRFSFKTNENSPIQTETKLDQILVRKRFQLVGPGRKYEKNMKGRKTYVIGIPSLTTGFGPPRPCGSFGCNRSRQRWLLAETRPRGHDFPFWRRIEIGGFLSVPEESMKVVHFPFFWRIYIEHGRVVGFILSSGTDKKPHNWESVENRILGRSAPKGTIRALARKGGQALAALEETWRFQLHAFLRFSCFFHTFFRDRPGRRHQRIAKHAIDAVKGEKEWKTNTFIQIWRSM